MWKKNRFLREVMQFLFKFLRLWKNCYLFFNSFFCLNCNSRSNIAETGVHVLCSRPFAEVFTVHAQCFYAEAHTKECLVSQQTFHTKKEETSILMFLEFYEF